MKVEDDGGGNGRGLRKHRKRKRGSGSNDPSYRLGYIDFGMLSTIPSTVQDGLICAVCQLIFANNVTAVGELFGELQLLPLDVLEDPVESAALSEELTLAISKVLVFPPDDDDGGGGNAAKIPTLRFDELLDVLVRLVPRFRFQLPPYFLNNARALATLEGMAREVDPSFNILRNLYPYAIRRVFSNPTGSPVVEKTLRSLVETPATGRLDPGKIRTLVKDASRYSGYSRRRVVSDVAGSESGPGLVARLVREQAASRLRRVAGRETTRKTKRKNGDGGPGGTKRPRAGRRVLDRLGDCLRL